MGESGVGRREKKEERRKKKEEKRKKREERREKREADRCEVFNVKCQMSKLKAQIAMNPLALRSVSSRINLLSPVGISLGGDERE